MITEVGGRIDGIEEIDEIEGIEGIEEIEEIDEVMTRGRGEMGTRGWFEI